LAQVTHAVPFQKRPSAQVVQTESVLLVQLTAEQLSSPAHGAHTRSWSAVQAVVSWVPGAQARQATQPPPSTW
jgi:hypothetical protein